MPTDLRKEANEIAQSLHAQIPQLDAQLREIEARKAEIEIARNTASLAPQRALDYRERLGADFQ
jgi:hypothetical protein